MSKWEKPSSISWFLIICGRGAQTQQDHSTASLAVEWHDTRWQPSTRRRHDVHVTCGKCGWHRTCGWHGARGWLGTYGWHSMCWWHVTRQWHHIGSQHGKYNRHACPWQSAQKSNQRPHAKVRTEVRDRAHDQRHAHRSKHGATPVWWQEHRSGCIDSPTTP